MASVTEKRPGHVQFVITGAAAVSPEALYVVRRPGKVLLAGGHEEQPHHRANGDWRLNPASQELPHHPHRISLLWLEVGHPEESTIQCKGTKHPLCNGFSQCH